jgi:hypothetical protein
VSLIVTRKAPVAADPRQGAFHDPALWQDNEAANIAALHNLERPGARAGDEGPHLGSGITTIGDDALNERKTPPRLPQQLFGAVAVLDIRGMDIDVQQQALRIDQDVTLASKDLLPRIVTGRVKRAPPFTAPLALCASRIAVVGLASRPELSRLST